MAVAPELLAHVRPPASAQLRLALVAAVPAAPAAPAKRARGRAAAADMAATAAASLTEKAGGAQENLRIVRVRQEMLLLLKLAGGGARAFLPPEKLGEKTRRTLCLLGHGPCIAVCALPADGEHDGEQEVAVPAFLRAHTGGKALVEPALRADLTHEPGLENLPRAFAAYTAAVLASCVD
ncbi:hypothetical protein T492DRAFT_905087 [Pavlovales sp. CCMP2436]|nr:hypothetical protein T492DRAFT_905087 [Pavlovales sp. CCMP2436]